MLILAAALVCLAIHLFTMALTGSLVGVRLQVIALGIGPQLLKVGVFRLGLWPFGGHVRFLDTRMEAVPAEDMTSAFDARSTVEKVFIILSGCLMLLLVADATSESSILPALLSLPSQVVAGAISPFGDAQALIRGAIDTARPLSFLALLGIVATKVAAFNLLPLSPLNGGAAIGALARGLGLVGWWPPAATRTVMVSLMALFVSWSVALGVYFLNS